MTATVPTGPSSDDAQDYWTLRDHVIDRLNPPDGETSEVHGMCTAIDRAAAFIETIPCTCPPGAADPMVYDDPCDRCAALGRCADEREER